MGVALFERSTHHVRQTPATPAGLSRRICLMTRAPETQARAAVQRCYAERAGRLRGRARP